MSDRIGAPIGGQADGPFTRCFNQARYRGVSFLRGKLGELRVATFQFVGLVLLAFVICPIITKHLPISR